MIKKTIDVDGYWKVIVYYNIDYNFFDIIAKDLYRLTENKSLIKRVFSNMYLSFAKAVTISDIHKHESIVCFNNHKSYYDYVNSIIHEAEHVKQHILDAYNIEDAGEPPAYTIGYIGMKMLQTFLVKIKN